MNDYRVIFFLHIPKTGGTSLQEILTRHYPADKICPVQVQPEFDSIPDTELLKYRLFSGHYHGLIKRLPITPTIITFLREPVDRAISMYKHILRDPGHGLHKLAVSGASIDRLCRHPDLRNGQTELLSKNHKDYRDGLSEIQRLSLAKSLIDDCSFVGFTESYEESVDYLCDMLGLESVQKVPYLNKAWKETKNIRLSEDDMIAFATANQLDEEIYQYALNQKKVK